MVFPNVVLMFLYVEQDVNFAWQSCSVLKIENKEKKWKKSGEKCFAVSQSGMR